MISMRSKYALKALGYMARTSDKESFLIAEIAQAESIPKKFLEAILLTLKNNGILSSRKGPGGGYSLAKPPAALTVGAIVRSFEGDLAPVPCLSETAHSTCPECVEEDTCGIKLVMADVSQAVSSVLDTVTLADMLQRSEFERQKRQQVVDFAI
ncbi:MAG TPA: Rrf2 family transcriptional regulator [Geobacteraceae bacterium]|nr:Rrf2 family transcriptional regulator [Geobacteraceae bacterium]